MIFMQSMKSNSRYLWDAVLGLDLLEGEDALGGDNLLGDGGGGNGHWG